MSRARATRARAGRLHPRSPPCRGRRRDGLRNADPEGGKGARAGARLFRPRSAPIDHIGTVGSGMVGTGGPNPGGLMRTRMVSIAALALVAGAFQVAPASAAKPCI